MQSLYTNVSLSSKHFKGPHVVTQKRKWV